MDQINEIATEKGVTGGNQNHSERQEGVEKMDTGLETIIWHFRGHEELEKKKKNFLYGSRR